MSCVAVCGGKERGVANKCFFSSPSHRQLPTNLMPGLEHCTYYSMGRTKIKK